MPSAGSDPEACWERLNGHYTAMIGSVDVLLSEIYYAFGFTTQGSRRSDLEVADVARVAAVRNPRQNILNDSAELRSE